MRDFQARLLDLESRLAKLELSHRLNELGSGSRLDPTNEAIDALHEFEARVMKAIGESMAEFRKSLDPLDRKLTVMKLALEERIDHLAQEAFDTPRGKAPRAG